MSEYTEEWLTGYQQRIQKQAERAIGTQKVTQNIVPPTTQSVNASQGLKLDSAQKSKYRNKKITADGIVWDSKKEYHRWLDLKNAELAGDISELQRQVDFIIIPQVEICGRKERATVYKADFVYIRDGQRVIEDVKSEFTRKLPVYRLKRKLMRHIHGVHIFEV